MQPIDHSILSLYLIVLLCVGLYFKRKASRGLNEYFLGGRKIPWWALGVSGMASNLDMTGTMLISSFFYMLGMKGFLIELRGGVVLVLAFLMVFIGKWHSRSGVLTVAEWMEYRFGKGRQGDMARLLSTIAILTGTVGIVVYFFVGTGKFLSIFLPFPPKVCALILIAMASLFTTLGGLYGVVYTELIQGVLMGFTAIFISIKAFLSEDFATIQSMTPAGWSDIAPPWKMQMPSGYEMYNLFGVSVLFFFLKTVIEGLGAPGGYMAQRYFAAKSDRDSGKLSALWISLLAFRWPFIMGIAVLGLRLGARVAEPEMVLPTVLLYGIPAGLKGLMVAVMVAAAMSAFDSTINAGASYVVNDIYYKYINPHADNRQLVRAGYLSSVLIVVVGVFIGIVTPSINAIWRWITMSLVSGMIIPNFVRWYWWRLNGYGYAIGIGAGISAAVVQRIVAPAMQEWMAFLTVGSVSLLGLIAGTLFTRPTEQNVLEHFYRTTRPMGLWKKISEKMDVSFLSLVQKENRRDFTAMFFSVPWQISLFLTPTYAVIHKWSSFAECLLVLIVSSAGLYFFWFRHLKDNEAG